MYGHQVRLRALQMHAAGATIAAIHRCLGVSRGAIRDWTLNPSAALAGRERSACFACAGEPCEHPAIYESKDILAIMGTTLDRVGVQWRFNRPNGISIARRGSVQLVDDHVGPKT